MSYVQDRELAVQLVTEATDDEKSLAFQIISIPEIQQRIARLICPELVLPRVP